MPAVGWRGVSQPLVAAVKQIPETKASKIKATANPSFFSEFRMGRLLNLLLEKNEKLRQHLGRCAVSNQS